MDAKEAKKRLWEALKDDLRKVKVWSYISESEQKTLMLLLGLFALGLAKKYIF